MRRNLRSPRSSARRLKLESLESRQMLAGDPIISEFMASNNSTLDDGDGRSSDWIEIYNQGDEAIDLAGYSLTDDITALDKWIFPSVTVGSGEYLVVFASAPVDALDVPIDDYTDAGGNLHTNFSLSSGGEYLALVNPDGSTIATEFAPEFPNQREDIAYGVEQAVSFTTLLDAGDAAKLLVPTAIDDGQIGSTWTGGAEPFDDSAWSDVTVGVGFDTTTDPNPDPVFELTNVALGKTASQSTDGFGFFGTGTTDGNRSSISHTATGDLTPWVKVDLGEDFLIERIDVFTRTDCCTPAQPERDYNLTVEVLDAADNVVFTAAPFNPWDGTGAGAIDVGTGASFTVDLSGEAGGGVTGSRVRVSKVAFGGANSSEWLHLGEIEVFAEGEVVIIDDPEENFALGKPTSGDVAFGFPTTNGVDGNTGNITHSLNTGDVFWQVDLESPTNLGRIELLNRSDGCCPERLNGAVLSVLDESLNVIFTSDEIAGAGVGATLTFNNANAGFRNARYIRVDQSDQYLSIAELRAFGPEGYDVFITDDIEVDLKDVNASAYLRVPFSVDDASLFDNLSLGLNYDDGFVAYLNGTEFARDNAPAGTPGFDASATEENPGSLFNEFNVPLGLLQNGENILAIHGLNLSASDEDFLLLPQLIARSAPIGTIGYLVDATPGEPNGNIVTGFVSDTSFDVDRGFFETAFDVNITTSTPGATIIYTTDGSVPSLSNGVQVDALDDATPPVATLNITTTTTLRAAAFKDLMEPTNTDTQTYLFLADVLTQPSDPAGFPTTWTGSGNNAITADYELDPEVVNDPAYSDEIIEGLRAIPTMSIVMDPEDLFGDERGIYIFSGQRGRAWERPTSVEIIEPDGTSFQVDSGIRIHGFSWRFHTNTPKHSFRLEFRDEYGPRKLEYPLFPDSPVDKFDSIVLRAQGGRSWGGLQDPVRSQYLRGTFARDLAREMGAVDGSATLVHLYLNGLYWGLYNPVERPDAQFAEERFGGSDEDYDALNRRTSTTEAIDGDLVIYNEMIALANSAIAAGVTTDADYEAFQRFLAMDNFIDWFIRNQYVTNRDGLSAFDGNNQRAIGSRVGDAQFRFFVWDMEFSMWNATDNNNIGIGLNSPALAGGQNPPNSAWTVYTALKQNAEFRLRYADAVHKHLFNDGALTPEAAAATWEVRAESIEKAIIGESARWGDAKRATPYTRDVEWQAERDRLNNTYFPQRSAILVEQLRDVNLYTQLNAPEYFVDNKAQHGGNVDAGAMLSMISAESVNVIETSLLGPTNPASAYVPQDDNLGDAWRDVSFTEGADGETWQTGTNGVGYDTGTDYDSLINIDVEAGMRGDGGNNSVYVRLPFQIADQATIDGFDSIALKILADDGYVAYLNGVQIASFNAPSGITLDWQAASLGGGEVNIGSPSVLDITAFRDQLVVGDNVLAIQGLNISTASSDLLIFAELVGQTIDTTVSDSGIWYTADGTDPRMPGGAMSPSAIQYAGELPITESAEYNARAFQNDEWSALSQTIFSVSTPIRVSEIMFNPDGSDDAEFIELRNIGSAAVDLTGLQLVRTTQGDGIDYEFLPTDTNLSVEPGEFIVVVKDRLAFIAAHPEVPATAIADRMFTGSLSNEGETLTLVNSAGGVIQEFTYDDNWYDTTDGGGSSLVLIDASQDVATWNDSASWRPSVCAGGSPGKTDQLGSDVNCDGNVGLLDLALVQSDPAAGLRGTVTVLLRDFGRTFEVSSTGTEAGGSPVAESPVAAPAAVIQSIGDALLQRRTTIRTTRRATLVSRVGHATDSSALRGAAVDAVLSQHPRSQHPRDSSEITSRRLLRTHRSAGRTTMDQDERTGGN